MRPRAFLDTNRRDAGLLGATTEVLGQFPNGVLGGIGLIHS
jgi:hypothetical protein